MTHTEAIRHAAIKAQRMGAFWRRESDRHRDDAPMADMFSKWAAEQYAIARGLMGIDEDAA